jgi:hypothetical protein
VKRYRGQESSLSADLVHDWARDADLGLSGIGLIFCMQIQAIKARV